VLMHGSHPSRQIEKSAMKRHQLTCTLALTLAATLLLTGCGGRIATATVTPLPTDTPDLPATAARQAFIAARTAVVVTQAALAEALQTASAAQTAGAATLTALDAAGAALNQTATAGAASLAASQTAVALAAATLEAGRDRLAAQQTALAGAIASSTAGAQAATATSLAVPTATPSPIPPVTVEAWQEVTLPAIGVRAILPPGFTPVESDPTGAIFERIMPAGGRAIITFNTDAGDLPAAIDRNDPVALLQAALDDPANAGSFEVLEPAAAYAGLRYPAALARVRLPDTGVVIAYLTLKLDAGDWLFFSLAGAEEDVGRWLPAIAPGIAATGRES